MNKTPIEWTDFSANPLKFKTADGRVVWACEKLSPGCKNCYAEDLSHRYGGVRRAGEWNAATMATLTPFLDEAELHKMLTYKPASGKRCFIGDMTDIFGEWVPDDLLNRLFSQVLELRQDVTWQLLTKRADRLHRYLSWRWGPDDEAPLGRIPSRNIHVGVSVEDQPRADERVPLLLQTPAAVRFISAEPLLGPVDIERSLQYPPFHEHYKMTLGATEWHGLDWVIVGGESGSSARPSDVAWIRSLVQQCQAAGVPVFVKQLGQNAVCRNDERDEGWPGCTVPIDDDYEPRYQGETAPLVFHDRKGGNPEEWPEDLRVRQFPEVRA